MNLNKGVSLMQWAASPKKRSGPKKITHQGQTNQYLIREPLSRTRMSPPNAGRPTAEFSDFLGQGYHFRDRSFLVVKSPKPKFRYRRPCLKQQSLRSLPATELQGWGLRGVGVYLRWKHAGQRTQSLGKEVCKTGRPRSSGRKDAQISCLLNDAVGLGYRTHPQ